MRKVFIFITVCNICVPVFATTKCIKNITSCTNTWGGGGNPEWQATCNGTIMKGTYACSDITGTNTGEQRDSLSGTSYDASTHKYCWCRILSPLVSKWTYVSYTMNDVNQCNWSCPNQCAAKIQNNTTFRTAIFSDIN